MALSKYKSLPNVRDEFKVEHAKLKKMSMANSQSQTEHIKKLEYNPGKAARIHHIPSYLLRDRRYLLTENLPHLKRILRL